MQVRFLPLLLLVPKTLNMNYNYLEKIERIIAIRKEKEKLLKEEKEVSTPTLTDYDKLPIIYEWFKSILKDRPCPPNINTVLQRKKFLFIALYLYCPNALCGDILPHGFRNCISSLFPNVSSNAISLNISDIVFLYRHNYDGFKNDIDETFYKIMERIQQG